MRKNVEIYKFNYVLELFFFMFLYFWFKVDLRYYGMRVMDLNFCVNVVVILFVDVSKLNLNYEYC